MASEKEWESKRFSGDWKNFGGGGILSGSWQADSDGCLMKEIQSLDFFKLSCRSGSPNHKSGLCQTSLSLTESVL